MALNLEKLGSDSSYMVGLQEEAPIWRVPPSREQNDLHNESNRRTASLSRAAHLADQTRLLEAGGGTAIDGLPMESFAEGFPAQDTVRYYVTRFSR